MIVYKIETTTFNLKVAWYSSQKNGDVQFRFVFLGLLPVWKQRVPFLCEIISKEFEFVHKSSTMTCEYGGYFIFKVI